MSKPSNDYEGDSIPPDAPDLTASGARIKAPVGISRGSRPSAFGLPRTSNAPPDTLPPQRALNAEPPRAGAAHSSPAPRYVESSAPPPPLYSSEPPPLPGVPSVPLVTSSLPAIPAAARSDSSGTRPAASSSRPWLGLIAFALMAFAVTFSLLRARPTAPQAAAPTPSAPALSTPAPAPPAAAPRQPTAAAARTPAPEASAPVLPSAAIAASASPSETAGDQEARDQEARSRAGWIRAFEANLPSDKTEAAESLRGRGEEALTAGDAVLAEMLLEKALQLDDANPHTAMAMARLQISRDRLQEAEAWVLRAIDLRPRRAEYRESYATLLKRLGRREEAVRAHRKARSLSH